MHRHDTFPSDELVSQYRTVFSSPAGKEVLRHMLYDLGVLMPIVTDEDKHLANYGQRVLTILGGGTFTADALDVMAVRVMRQPLRREET